MTIEVQCGPCFEFRANFFHSLLFVLLMTAGVLYYHNIEFEHNGNDGGLVIAHKNVTHKLYLNTTPTTIAEINNKDDNSSGTSDRGHSKFSEDDCFVNM